MLQGKWGENRACQLGKAASQLQSNAIQLLEVQSIEAKSRIGPNRNTDKPPLICYVDLWFNIFVQQTIILFPFSSDYNRMIKESFLRNYSLSKIYNQAEDEKNKLKVYYLREVNKILKDRHKKARMAEVDKLSQANKENRLKERINTKLRTEYRKIRTQPNQHICMDEPVTKSKIKVVELKLERQSQAYLPRSSNLKFSIKKGRAIKGRNTLIEELNVGIQGNQ